MYITKVIDEMKLVFKDIPYGVEHTLKVLKNAEDIMQDESISEVEKELISIATVLHDIGVMEAHNKYGSMEAAYQEKEGPYIARSILEKIGYPKDKIDRICYIVGNHHTPSKIDGLDFQILWEADLLENLAYMDVSKNHGMLNKYIDENFQTVIGRNKAYELFKS